MIFTKKDCCRILRFHANALPVKIFMLFWLIFLLLMMVSFIIPRFDQRLFLPVPTDMISQYQAELSLPTSTEKISRLLASDNSANKQNLKWVNENRLILVDYKGNIIGAQDNELHFIQQFYLSTYNSHSPIRKVFYNFQIIGPFPLQLHINKSYTSDEDIIDTSDYTLYLARYVKPQSALTNLIFDSPFGISMLLMALISPLIWWLVSSISKPIRHLQEAANQVALGNFKVNKELEISGVSEIRQVGESFNRMAEAIKDLILNRQSLLSSISHELRTPLTRLQLSLSLLRRRVGDTGEIQRIQIETERLDKMIKDLLSLSHQHLKSQLFREIIPITELWEGIKEDVQFEAEQLNITCVFKQNFSFPGQYKISANRESILSAIENVLRNALKYAKKRIEVTEYLGYGNFFICIDDDGEGVPVDEYENIFKPFYRVDPDNPNRKEGTGLGLAIVNDVVKQHNGNVWAESSPLGGLRITLKFSLHKT